MNTREQADEAITGLKKQAYEAMYATFEEERGRQLDLTRRALDAVGIEVPEGKAEVVAMVDAKGKRWHVLCFDGLAFSVSLSAPDRPLVWMDHLERFVPFYSMAQLGEMLQRAGAGTVKASAQEMDAIHRINVTVRMLHDAIVNEAEAREAEAFFRAELEEIEARIILGAYNAGTIDGRNAQIRDRQETAVLAESEPVQAARERLRDVRYSIIGFEAERRRMEALVRLEVARLRSNGRGGGE